MRRQFPQRNNVELIPPPPNRYQGHRGRGHGMWSEDFIYWGYRLALLNARDVDIARAFDVTEPTINQWKIDYPEFARVLKEGREYADATVATSLFRRAIGYSKRVEKVLLDKEGQEVLVSYQEEVPPDVTAQIFWLKNRQSENWRDRHLMEVRKHSVAAKLDLKMEPGQAYRLFKG